MEAMIPIKDGIVERCIFVALGSFNPAILHPDWFDRHKIMPAEEIAGLFAEPITKEIPEIGVTLEAGKYFLVDPTQSITHFKSFSLKVERGQFQLLCEKKEKFPLMLEFIKKFFMVLPETPVSAYGINFDEHIKFRESTDTIIDKFFIVAKGINEFFGSDPKYGHIIYTKKEEVKIRFKIEPSHRLDDAVFLSINFHYDNTFADNDFIVKKIDRSFMDSLKFTETLISKYCGEMIERLPTVLGK